MFLFGVVRDRVVDSRVEQFLLEFLDRKPDSSPVFVLGIQVGLSAMDEREILTLEKVNINTF